MTSLEVICRELQELGYHSELVRFPNFTVDDGQAVVFDYNVDVGAYRGNSYKIGISFQDTGYPEYPPHFLHIYNAPRLNRTAHAKHAEGTSTWSAYSVPPSDFWDRLPVEHKNMKTYLNRHVRRFWADT